MVSFGKIALTGLLVGALSACAPRLSSIRTTDWGRGLWEYEEFRKFDRGYSKEDELILSTHQGANADTGDRLTLRRFDRNGDRVWDVEQLWQYDEEGNLLGSTWNEGVDESIEEQLINEYAPLSQPREREVYRFGRTISITRTEEKYLRKETHVIHEQGKVVGETSNCYRENGELFLCP